MTAVITHEGKFIARIDSGSLLIDYKCSDPSYCPPYKATFYPGKYSLECWGAESGEINHGYSGKGGYSKGTISIMRKTKAYLHIGGKGQYHEGEKAKGGNNGGSDGIYNVNTNVKELFYSSGGGATDIRLLNNNLLSRVIVAGGGGGQGHMLNNEDKHYDGKGGSGGGFEGEDGYSHYNKDIGQGGKANKIAESYYKSSFGKGGLRGGGGGWYGGAGSQNGNGNGGGSGFVFNSKNYIPTDYQLSDEYMLTNTSLITGNTTIISPMGGEEIGHHGNGAIRITIIEHFSFKGYICFTKQFSNKPNNFIIYLYTMLHPSS